MEPCNVYCCVGTFKEKRFNLNLKNFLTIYVLDLIKNAVTYFSTYLWLFNKICLEFVSNIFQKDFVLYERNDRKMAKKSTTVFVCNECGYESSKWLGKCPACGQWNSFFEEKVVSGGTSAKEKSKTKSEVIKLNQVEKKTTIRVKTGVQELDRVLGGGFVKGSLTLLRWRTWNWKININFTDM